MLDWHEVDERLEVANPFVMADEERKTVARIEQEAFEAHLPRISELLKSHQEHLENRGFWTELTARSQGLRFRYSKVGFYGPGGFSSQFHIAGPLVLGRIDPKGDAVRAFYSNDLEQSVFLGERFDEAAFAAFVREDLLAYISPENQILSPEQYAWLKRLVGQPRNLA